MNARVVSLNAFVRRWALDALGAFLAVLYALPSLRYPFGMDQPIHWYLGRRLLDGEMPYASGISTKPPGVFVVHAISIAIFGDHMSSVRIVDILNVLVIGVLVATFRPTRRRSDGSVGSVRPLSGGEIGAACLATSAILYTFFDWTNLGHPDTWQGMTMVLAAWIVVRAPDGEISLRRAFAAGFVACLAVSFKHVAAITGVFFGAAVVLIALRQMRPIKATLNGLAYGAGVGAGLLMMVLPFYLTGTFDAFWEMMVDHILRYADQASGESARIAGWLAPEYGLPAAVIGVGLTVSGIANATATRDRREQWTGAAIVISMIAAMISVIAQKRAFVASSYSYHFLVLVPMLTLGISYGLRHWFPRRGAMQLACVVLLAAAAFRLEPAWISTADHNYRAEWRTFADVVLGRVDSRDALEPYTGHHRLIDNYARQSAAADEINRLKRPGDTLCVDSFIGAIYQETGLRCTSRFMVSLVFLPTASPEWRAEEARMWTENPPTFFVTFSDRGPFLHEMQQRGYVRHDVDDGLRPFFVVLERRAPPPAEDP